MSKYFGKSEHINNKEDLQKEKKGICPWKKW